MNSQDNTEEGRLQDELPLEVRLKYLTEAFRKNEKRIKDLTRYAQGLEEENLSLQKKLHALEENEIRKDYLRKLKAKFCEVRAHLIKNYPMRVVQVRALKKRIANMTSYIHDLQTILRKNGIEYPERTSDPLENESNYDIESIDEYAVRGPNEKYEGDFFDVNLPANR
ncbi:MAG: hypothetical protein IIV77_07170 [Bacteroidaceae bacterium]|nr:hypothetical protein [Bacteroidaceae bacterium]MBQ5714253.1 hypothetical protein [Bacteroidaceae bacterium]